MTSWLVDDSPMNGISRSDLVLAISGCHVMFVLGYLRRNRRARWLESNSFAEQVGIVERSHAAEQTPR